jgi:hypothetical protein
MTRPLVERLRDDAQNEDIASCAEAADEIDTLRALLLESKRTHYVCDGDCWYSCPKSGQCCNEEPKDKCDCGADAWNAKVDAALAVSEVGR